MNHDAAIMQTGVDSKRHPDHQHKWQLAAGGDHLRERFQRSVQQSVLLEKVFVRVRREAQLGKQHQHRARLGRLTRQLYGRCGVERR